MPRPRKTSPASYVIGLFGVRPLAAVLDVDPGAVCKWRARNGRVPSKHQAALLTLARKRGVELSAEDLIA
jgi:hypothetical protein